MTKTCSSAVMFGLMELWLLLTAMTSSSAFADEEWEPPLPPGYKPDTCVEKEIKSDPVASYRISPTCTIADIREVGHYQYGIEEVKNEIRQFESTEVSRRFIDGQFQYINEIRIELHKALDEPATLLCHVDMMGQQVLDATILREYSVDDKKPKQIEETVTLENAELPDMGVFTHSKTVMYQTNHCH